MIEFGLLVKVRKVLHFDSINQKMSYPMQETAIIRLPPRSADMPYRLSAFAPLP